MKFLTKAAIAGAAITATVLSTAPAAFADGDPSDCPSGYACIWVDIHYLTNGSRFTHLDTFYYRATLPSTYDAEASSAYNNGTGGQGVYYYKGQRCPSGGARFLMAAGTGDSDFTNGSPAGDFQDAVRSLVFNSSSLISQCRAA
jgi:hypothetical protein